MLLIEVQEKYADCIFTYQFADFDKSPCQVVGAVVLGAAVLYAGSRGARALSARSGSLSAVASAVLTRTSGAIASKANPPRGQMTATEAQELIRWDTVNSDSLISKQ